MQESEAPAFSLAGMGESVLNHHGLVNDSVDPVKALCPVRVRHGAEQRHVVVLIIMRQNRNIVGVCQSRAVAPRLHAAQADDIRLPKIQGIPADQLASIRAGLKETSRNSNQHIGLANTNSRLVLSYGEGSVLHMNSRCGKFTVIWFSIPVPDET